MEQRQGINAPAFATAVVVCIEAMILLQGGGFLLLLLTRPVPVPGAVLLGAAVACYLGWLILLMNYLLAWRRDPSVRFGTRRKRWTAILLPATAILLLVWVLAGQG